MINKQSYQIKGMRQDNLVGTGYSTQFAHEIMNMRLNTVGDYTTASWTTEEGTKEVPIVWTDITMESQEIGNAIISDTTPFYPLGQAVINDNWIIFATRISQSNEKQDVIFKFWYDEDMYHTVSLYGTILYFGNLGFDTNHPIETITSYENEDIQKVYWTDGINQPRMINIKNVKYKYGRNTQFDFTQEVSLNEQVTIKKLTQGAGMFPPGTVKYAISYYTKYGQESNIVYDSPLFYPVIGNRGCSPDEISGDSFEIQVTGLDVEHNFDYIRLYSIVRTSENATPIVRIVEDKPISGLYNGSVITFSDTNTTGRIIDPTIIQYIGGKEITAYTLAQKDNTLFLGNIELKTRSVTKILKNLDFSGYDGLYMLRHSTIEFIKDNDKAIGVRVKKPNVTAVDEDYSVYQYITELSENTVYDFWNNNMKEVNGNSHLIKIFKYGETYRFGIQFQDNKGVWSEVVFLKDIENTVVPSTGEYDAIARFGILHYVLPRIVAERLFAYGYKKARIVCCYPTNADRTILAQGVLAPTVWNFKEHANHSPDVMSSWFFRPNEEPTTMSPTPDNNSKVLPWQHEDYLRPSFSNNCEIQCLSSQQSETTYTDNYTYDAWDDGAYHVSRSILTFHSPDIEFDDSLRTLDLTHAKVYIIGNVPIQSYASAYYVDANSPMSTVGGHKGTGFVNNLAKVAMEQWSAVSPTTTPRPGSHILNASYWDDRDVYHWNHASAWGSCQYPLYPFQRIGSLNNYSVDKNSEVSEYSDGGDGNIDITITQTAKLNSKVFSTILYSSASRFAEDNNIGIERQIKADSFGIFDSKEIAPIKLDVGTEALIYYGNVNTIAPITKQSLRCFKDSKDVDNPLRLYGDYKIYEYVPDTEERLWCKGYLYPGGNTDDGRGGVCSDPVPITFKSSAHGVFYSGEEGEINSLVDIERNTTDLTLFKNQFPFLYLAEIRRDVDANTRFGGDPETNPTIQNIYIPCGEAFGILNTIHPSNNVDMYGREGDSYYMRYDNLKTYPFTTEDTNQVVEILSFMCETRINLDGRYDRNRGMLDNTTITSTNFNLLNKSYTQSNNLFTYTTLDELAIETDKLSTQFTWTKTKVVADDIDLWTNITLASVADADGTLGDITKIFSFKDKLLLFQPNGIAQIGFNEKTALTTEAGIPLEIANSGKYTGLTYLANNVGCQNKWSVCSSKDETFFIDDYRKEILLFNNELTSISTANGFDAFLIQELPSADIWTPWTPTDTKNFVAYYDKISNDVFYINKDWCLAWNEQSKTFTSFYSYNNVPYIANIGSHTLMLSSEGIQINNLAYNEDVTETVLESVPRTENIEVYPWVPIYEEQTVVTTNPTDVIINQDELYSSTTHAAVWYSYAEDPLSPDLEPQSPYDDVQLSMINYTPLDRFAKFTFTNYTYDPTVSVESNYHLIFDFQFNKINSSTASLEDCNMQVEINANFINATATVTDNVGWKLNPINSVTYRFSDNVTDEEKSRFKVYFVGTDKPTILIGNISYTNNSGTYTFTSQNPSPWHDVVYDRSLLSNDLYCRTTIYNLNTASIDDRISAFYDVDTYVTSSGKICTVGLPWVETYTTTASVHNASGGSFNMEYCKADNIKYKYLTVSTSTTTVATLVQDTSVTPTIQTITVWDTITKTITTSQYVVNPDVTATPIIWAARENDYNCCQFFGEYKPYWMTFVCDGMTDKGFTFPVDKVFNNIEYRADVFDRISGLPRADINLPVFNLKAAYNGYQAYKEFPIDAVRKFNTWRVQLPRATYYENGQFVTTRDRIRNPFCYIKLMNTDTEHPLQHRMILHDLAVYFDMK